MARGGFISAEVAVKKVFKVAESQKRAMHLITDSLISGLVQAKGRPLSWPSQSDNLKDGKKSSRGMSLVDISAPGEPDTGDPENIEPSFWHGISQSAVEMWDWPTGYFVNPESSGQYYSYIDVAFSERDVNRLINKQKLFLPSGPVPQPKKERRRDASWGEWVAAAVHLACEQQIHAGMGQTQLLDLINARLRRWGAKEKENSTVSPTARVILDKLLAHPPASPLMTKATVEPKP